jgi:hypothetical protein
VRRRPGHGDIGSRRRAAPLSRAGPADPPGLSRCSVGVPR